MIDLLRSIFVGMAMSVERELLRIVIQLMSIAELLLGGSSIIIIAHPGKSFVVTSFLLLALIFRKGFLGIHVSICSLHNDCTKLSEKQDARSGNEISNC